MGESYIELFHDSARLLTVHIEAFIITQWPLITERERTEIIALITCKLHNSTLATKPSTRPRTRIASKLEP